MELVVSLPEDLHQIRRVALRQQWDGLDLWWEEYLQIFQRPPKSKIHFCSKFQFDSQEMNSINTLDHFQVTLYNGDVKEL